ncbi:MAG TPA: hypothetical protein VFT88_06685 [Acidobacteriaceae bacterium]|nr:hypothetical protein [Acidobacteriaceae bacterium]
MSEESRTHVSQRIMHRAKAFRAGVVLLVVAVLPWAAWVLWLGRNDPFENPILHHRWVMKIAISFAAGASTSLISSMLLLFGKGWKRVLYTAFALCLLLLYTATLLVGD